jgi:hypothetical protein
MWHAKTKRMVVFGLYPRVNMEKYNFQEIGKAMLYVAPGLPSHLSP